MRREKWKDSWVSSQVKKAVSGPGTKDSRMRQAGESASARPGWHLLSHLVFAACTGQPFGRATLELTASKVAGGRETACKGLWREWTGSK